MSKRKLFVAGFALVLSSQSLFAGTSEVQVVGTTVSDAEITIHVENIGASARSVTVEVSVQLENGSTQVLTTSPVSVPALATASVTVTAGDTIVQIDDDPQPTPL